MDTLFLIGLTVFVGTLGGKLCQQFKIPQVTGYILVGLLLGKHAFGLWDSQMIERFVPISNLALGIIGFMIGSELKFDLFRKRGRSIYSILFCEVVVTFSVVAFFVTLLTQKVYLGILFGALGGGTGALIGALIQTEKWEPASLKRLNLGFQTQKTGDLLVSLSIRFD